MKDGEILGFDDYVKTFKAADPSAILPDGGMVQFSTSAPGGNRQPANAHEAANAAFRAASAERLIIMAIDAIARNKAEA